MNTHCGKHDKIVPEGGECPGCKTEREALEKSDFLPTPPKANIMETLHGHGFLEHPKAAKFFKSLKDLIKATKKKS